MSHAFAANSLPVTCYAHIESIRSKCRRIAIGWVQQYPSERSEPLSGGDANEADSFSQ
jgi:hypothetical protein